MKKLAKSIFAFFILMMIFMSFSSNVYAGRWRRTKVGWWYDYGDGTWPASKWRWIDGNADGIGECYYFNKDGYLLVNTTTPDGYTVNTNGAWHENGNVKTRKITHFDGAVVSMIDGELDLLAALIECEAVGEPKECQIAVGSVVINRVKDSRFPNTIRGVIYQKKQFSPVASGKLTKVLDRGALKKSYEAAREALLGRDDTNGCIFFRVNDGREGVVIGNTVFYHGKSK